MNTLAFGVWFAAVCLSLVIVIALGTFDVLLMLANQETVTEFLRDHPGWFVFPAACCFLFFLLLGIHLYVIKV